MSLKSDAVTLMLASLCNTNLSTTERATKIRKCSKLLQSRAKDKSFKRSLRAFRKCNNDVSVIKQVDVAISSFMDIKKLCR